MATTYISKEALTVVRLQGGSRVNVHKGGFVPGSADLEDVKRLVREGFLEQVEIVEDGDDDGGEESGSAKRRTIPEVLAGVGDDPAKAAAALEAERAGENRSTLVTKLEEIATKPPADGDGDGDADGGS